MHNEFTPIQPDIIGGKSKVDYQEAFPNEHLRKYIYCYWQLKTRQPLEDPFAYRVVADGCMDIIWEVEKPHQNFVIGFSSSHTVFPLNPSFHYFGVRFLPAAFPLLFQIDASELTHKFEALNQVLPKVSQRITAMSEEVYCLHKMKIRLDDYFQQRLKLLSDSLDPRLDKALEVIVTSQGSITIEKELEAGISPRQLRRLFKFYVGDSPKVFSRVVRFQQLLKAKPSRESLRKNKLFYDLGYYDQAHFIKEFKYMYGVPPTDALK